MTLSVLAALAPGATAHEGDAPSSALTGEIRLDQDLRVGVGDTLHAGPGATFTGTGRILVHGHMTVHGNATHPVTFRTPVLTFPGSVVTVHDSVHATPGATSVDARGGTLTFTDARFVDGVTGVRWEAAPAGADALVLRDVAFGAVGTGVTVAGSGTARVVNGSFDGPFVGVDVTLGPDALVDARVQTAWFRESVMRVRVLDGAPSGSGVTVTGSTFEGGGVDAGVHAAAGRPALAVHVLGANASTPFVALESTGNTFLGHEVGLAVHAPGDEGDASGARVVSERDAFEGNAVGVRVANALVDVRNASFAENALWDVHAPAPSDRGLTLTNAPPEARVLAAPAAVAPAPGTGPGAGVALVAGVLVVAGVLAGAAARPLGLGVLPVAARALLPANALDTVARSRVREYVTANPGVTLARVAEVTSVPRLAVLVHAFTLERDGVFARQRARDGRELYFVRHAPAEPARAPPATGAPVARAPADAARPPRAPALTRAERDVLEAVLANEGTTQSGLADALGLTRQAVHYQVKKLVAAGLVTKVPHGRETRLFARDEAKAALGASE